MFSAPCIITIFVDTVEDMLTLSMLRPHEEHFINSELSAASFRIWPLQLMQMYNLLTSIASIFPLMASSSFPFGFNCSAAVELSLESTICSLQMVIWESLVVLSDFFLKKLTLNLLKRYDFSFSNLSIMSSQTVTGIAAVKSTMINAYKLLSNMAASMVCLLHAVACVENTV